MRAIRTFPIGWRACGAATGHTDTPRLLADLEQLISHWSPRINQVI